MIGKGANPDVEDPNDGKTAHSAATSGKELNPGCEKVEGHLASIIKK